MNLEEIKEYFEIEAEKWDLAKNNINALEHLKRKPFKVGDLEGWIQFNPARAISSLAKLDKESVKKRECFLCRSKRPKEQSGIEIIKDWELLINPFPILPYHFTIVYLDHIPQELDVEVGYQLSQKLPGMVVLFNGEGAGASAPDHLHFQAVPFSEMPLIKLVDKHWDGIDKLEIPFKIITDPNKLSGLDYPVNAYFWLPESYDEPESDKDNVRFLAIPRITHRPKEYFLDPPARRAVSPGAIDMVGVIVTPIEEDYNKLTSEEIKDFFSQIALPNE